MIPGIIENMLSDAELQEREIANRRLSVRAKFREDLADDLIATLSQFDLEEISDHRKVMVFDQLYQIHREWLIKQISDLVANKSKYNGWCGDDGFGDMRDALRKQRELVIGKESEPIIIRILNFLSGV